MPQTFEQIPITPSILKWARETAGYSIADLSDKNGFKKISDWEAGISYPTYPQLERIAEKFHRPLAVFFFPEPPEEEPIENSLRLVPPEESNKLTPGLRQLFKKAKAFQFNLKKLLEDEEELQKEKINWINQLRYVKEITELASKTREILNISVEMQTSWKDDESALKNWRDKLEFNGLYIFKDAFRDDSLSGFCIYDNLCPIIYINNSQIETRQIFTIFHEVAHLIFRESYLDLSNNQFSKVEFEKNQNIEVRCNKFANEFLVPQTAFNQLRKNKSIDENTFIEIAKRFHVSREVILRKYLDNGLITRSFYQQMVQKWQDTYKSKQSESETPSKGGNFYNTRISYLGNNYISLVLGQYNRGRLNLKEAAYYLDVKPDKFPKLENNFLSRGGE